MIAEELLNLPPWIEFEGIHFKFQIINNGGDLRLVYAITGVDLGSPHRAVYDNFRSWLNKLVDANDPPLQGFLILYENIETDVGLCWAARDCWLRLCKMGLITDKPEMPH